MAEMNIPVAERQTLHWGLAVGEVLHQVPVEVVTNHQDPDMFVLLGLGEAELLEEVVAYLGQEGLKAAGVHIKYPGQDIGIDTGEMTVGETIQATAEAALPAVADYFDTANGHNPPKRYHLLCTSKGTGDGLIAADAAIHTGRPIFGTIGLLNCMALSPGLRMETAEPIVFGEGFSRAEFGVLRTFQGRVSESGFSVKGGPPLSKEELKRFVFAVQQFAYPILKRIVAAGHMAGVFSGAEDLVFPPNDSKEELGDLAYLLHEIPGRGHAWMKTPEGKADLGMVGYWINDCSPHHTV